LTWKDEFEESYAVPAEIAEHPALEDDSWHNNTCPTFHHEVRDLTVWVEHPDLAEREGWEHRFAVTWGSYVEADAQVLYEGDDLAQVLYLLDTGALLPVEDCGAPWRGDGGANGLECLLPIGHEGNHRAEWADAEWTEAETKPEVTVYTVPVECWVTVTDGEVTKVAIAPLESAAYYEGQGACLWEGEDTDAQREALDHDWAPLAGLPANVRWEG
jgi:hypothetical protein